VCFLLYQRQKCNLNLIYRFNWQRHGGLAKRLRLKHSVKRYNSLLLHTIARVNMARRFWRDILSVRLILQCWYLCRAEMIVGHWHRRTFYTLCRAITVVFWAQLALWNWRDNPLQRGALKHGVEKCVYAYFYRNRLLGLSLKRSEVRSWLLWITNRTSGVSPRGVTRAGGSIFPGMLVHLTGSVQIRHGQGCSRVGTCANDVSVNIFVRERRSGKHVSYQRERWY